MKKISIFAIFMIVVSGTSRAETIVCEPKGRGDIKKITAIRHPHGYEPQWFDVIVKQKGLFAQDLKFSLSPLYLAGDKMLLMEFEGSPQKTKFLMSFAKVGTLSQREQQAEVVLFKGLPGEQKQVMNCRSNNPIEAVNYCSDSKYGHVDQTLLYASKVRNSNLVDMIMSCQPQVNAMDKNGCSALMYAVDHLCGTGEHDEFRDFAHNKRIIDALIAGGSFVDLADPVTQETPLLKSVQDGDAYAVKAFADMEADIDAQDLKGFTPLMYAVSRGDVKLVELILNYNPDLNLRNSNGDTAQVIAQEKGYDQIELLLQKPDKILTFSGDSAGRCTLTENNVNVGKIVLMELKASDSKMFLLDIPGLELKLMVDPRGTKSVRIKPNKVGTYKYSCGVHGATISTQGIITVK